MLKRLITATLTIALLLTSLTFSTPAKAQRSSTAAPGAWQSAILIQNVGTGNADVTVDFYDKDGAIKESYTANALGANKSVTILVFNNPQSDGNTTCCDLASGQYSAVVSSTQPVVASVQTSSVASATAPWSAFAYEGVSAQNTGTTLYFPGNYKNYFSFFSEIVLQNAGSADTTASVEFFNQAGTKLGSTVNLGTIGLNRAVTFAMSDAIFNALPSGNTNGIFGAKVTSTGNVPLAGIVNIWATNPTNKTASYNAFTTGTTTLYAPSLSNNYYGFASALTVQNVDQQNSANIRIAYSNGRTEDVTLAPNAARAFYQPANTNLPSGNTNGVFSAKVTTTGGSIVGLVSYSAPPELNNNNAIGDFASYNCPPQATAQVNLPNVLSNYFGFFTNVTVQNTGANTANITLEYSTGQTWTVENVPANGVANFIHLNPNGTTIENPLGQRATVSAVAKTSDPTGSLVAVIQHNTEPSVSGFNSGKKPSDYLQAFSGTPK